MKFESWAAFWAMGGYGFYVWLSFAVTLLVLLGQVVVTVRTRKRLLREVSQKQARAARREAARKLENTL